MAFNIKSLADGQLPVVKTALYTCPPATTTIVKTITLVNADVVARAINLYLKSSGGVSRRIAPKDRTLAAGFLAETTQEYTLEAGDAVEGDASAAVAVDYTISGVEQA